MDGSKTSNGISRPSPEDLIIAQLEKSLLMMEADYAATIAAGTRQAPTAAAASVVPNVEGLNGHHAGIQDDDDWGSDGDEECGLPEGYQPLGMGGCETKPCSSSSSSSSTSTSQACASFYTPILPAHFVFACLA
jgi:hypothetical protein